MQHQSNATAQPDQVLSVAGFLGKRFHANHEARIKDPCLSESFIRQHEQKNYNEWFWMGEQVGKWLDSAVYSSLITKDQALLNQIGEIVDRLARAQEADGYLGITARYHRTPVRGMQLYEWYAVLHGLLVCAKLLNNPVALKIAQRLGEYIVRVWGTEPGQFPLVGRYPGNGHDGGEGTLILEPMVLLGAQSGDQRFIQWAEKTVAAWDSWYEVWPESTHSCSLTAMKQFASGEKQIDQLRDNLHAHTFHMNLLGIAALYNVTGKTEYRDIVTGCVKRIAEDWILITGGMSSGERYISRRFYHSDGEIEVCPQQTWLLLLEQLYQWTGDGYYLDFLERDVFNHLLAAQLADGSNWSYMTPLNGHAQEPTHPNCCNSSGQRILSRLPTYLYGLRNEHPALLLYTESKAVLRPSGLPAVTLEQTTNFPTSGEIKITVSPETEAHFPLHLRIPAYAQGAQVRINGEVTSCTISNGFIQLERTWQPNDTVDLSLPMPLTCQANTIEAAISRGPLVYAVFQNVQSNYEPYHWHRAARLADVELLLDPCKPNEALCEEAASTELVGPALHIAGHTLPRTPVFAQATANEELSQLQEMEFRLLPLVNQGAIGGEYQVFTRYTQP